MDCNRVEGNWKQFKGKVKEQSRKLTEGPAEKFSAQSRGVPTILENRRVDS
jgi:uncharacterized protein YjbJ (UPF0337 family)